MRTLLALLCLLSGCLPAYAYEPELIGGDPVDKAKFPEIVYIGSSDGRQSWHCSATVVGPQVILTAGHCVSDHGSIFPASHYVVVRDKSYSAKCRQAPLYRAPQKEDHDMALCKIDEPLDVAPASIASEGPQVGDDVVLAGFGCIHPGGGGGNDGVLRMGKAKVTQLPAGADHWFYTDFPSAALCYGDSGGPALLDSEKHLVIGVNSRGDIQRLSLLTATFTKESKEFFEEFAKEEGVEICGVTQDC